MKTIERLGTSSGKPAAQVRISDCGVTTAPAKAAVAAAAAAGSKRPADAAANKSKKATSVDDTAAAGIDNPEKNQKKIQLTSGLEYVDIKVHSAPPPHAAVVTPPLQVGTGQVATGGKKIVVGYKGVLKVPLPEQPLTHQRVSSVPFACV